jgi:hypothetical protein
MRIFTTCICRPLASTDCDSVSSASADRPYCGSSSSSVHERRTTPGLTKQHRLSTWPLVSSSPGEPNEQQSKAESNTSTTSEKAMLVFVCWLLITVKSARDPNHLRDSEEFLELVLDLQLAHVGVPVRVQQALLRRHARTCPGQCDRHLLASAAKTTNSTLSLNEKEK